MSGKILIIDEATELSPEAMRAATNAPSFVDLYSALDPKERLFVDEYLECLNATLAARRVWGHVSPKQTGYKALQRPDVKAAIDAGLREQNERFHNDPDRIIRELMMLAYADPRDLVDENGEYLALTELAPEIRRALASIEVMHEKVTTESGATAADAQQLDLSKISRGSVAERDYWLDQLKAEVERLRDAQQVTRCTRVIKYKLAAKTQNLELLGRRLKMFTDRLELDASDNLASLIAKAYDRPKPEAKPE